MGKDSQTSLVLSIASLDPRGQRVDWPCEEFPERSVWVLKEQGQWAAFDNLCPHWRCALDANGDDVLSSYVGTLRCTIHGAEFRRRDGKCVSGPCEGDSLVPFEVSDDGFYLTVRARASMPLRLSDVGFRLSLGGEE